MEITEKEARRIILWFNAARIVASIPLTDFEFFEKLGIAFPSLTTPKINITSRDTNSLETFSPSS